MTTYVTTSPDGVQIDLDSTPQVLAYAGTELQTITIQYQNHTYVQTFSYTASQITGISGWIKQ